jgi:alpha-1,3-glucosyltransferase
MLQMSLYFAPAFFGHLLGKCIKRKYPIVEVMKFGFVVLGTFAFVWWPFLHSYEAAMQVNGICTVPVTFFTSKPYSVAYKI